MNGRFMADDGRTFFSTEDPLEERDADGVTDVYEYVEGRPQLISSGTSERGTTPERIGLVGVSADGIDAFFTTYDSLVPQDENGPFVKFYDARTSGGIPFDKQLDPCAAADECHGSDSSPPPPLEVGTGAALGSGGNPEGEPSKKHHRRCRAKHRSHCRHGKGGNKHGHRHRHRRGGHAGGHGGH
jgi:hypothetical protein